MQRLVDDPFGMHRIRLRIETSVEHKIHFALQIWNGIDSFEMNFEINIIITSYERKTPDILILYHLNSE